MKKLYLPLFLAFFLLPNLTYAFFSDIPQEHEAYEAITALRKENIIKGFSEDGIRLFKPDQEVNRAEFLKMAYLSEAKRNEERFRSWEPPELFPFDDLKSISVEPPCFGDFLNLRTSSTRPQWFEVYACWGKERSLVKGYEDDIFDPLRTVNFAEAAKILLETSGQPVPEEDAIEHWAQGYIAKLNEGRIIPTSIQGADQPLNRAMAAQLIYNYNQADFAALQGQSTNAIIWDGQEYVLFENLGIARHFQLLKKNGEIYAAYLLGIDGSSQNYKKLQNVDPESFQSYQYYSQRTRSSGDTKYIMAGVATDQFSMLDVELNPIEGSAGGTFRFLEETFQEIPENFIGYGLDEGRAYLINCYEGCWPEILPNSNADDFEVIGNGFSRSGDQYYYLSDVIELPIDTDDLEFLTPILGKQDEKAYYFQPGYGREWQVREFDYLGMINLRTPSGGDRNMDYDEYYMSDGESVFMLKSNVLQEIESANVETFRLVNWGEKSLFAMDDQALYLEGEKVAESSLGAFEILGDFFELYHATKVGYYVSDGDQVFLASCWAWNQCEITEVPVANAKSFEHLREGYGVDGAQAYYAAQVLDLDLDTLNYLGQGYLKDKDHVYYPKYFSRDEVAIEITEADAQSFNLNLANNEDLFCTFPMAKDAENLYLANRVMKSVDNEEDSFFFEYSDPEDIDYDSFELLDKNGFFFRDKNGFYRSSFDEHACISGRWEKLEKAESDSFTPFKPHYYSSQGQVYFINRYADSLLSQADEPTFQPLIKTFNDSVDLKHSYVAKDVNFAYYKEDVIPLDIDVASFEYDHENQVLQDKNRQYTLEEIETTLEECAYGNGYEPVCGQLKEGQKSFRNSCLAKKAGSTLITDGLCTKQEVIWEQACLANNATWYPEWKMCGDSSSDDLNEQVCTEMGGKNFDDCGSGCSLYDDSDICPDMCVNYCSF